MSGTDDGFCVCGSQVERWAVRWEASLAGRTWGVHCSLPPFSSCWHAQMELGGMVSCLWSWQALKPYTDFNHGQLHCQWRIVCHIGNHPLSEGAISFYDSMNTFENKLPSARDVPPDFFCQSCQEVSKKVEKFLTDPGLYEEVDTLSSEVCHLLRSDLQIKCRQLVELYLREGILFLQIVFLEKNLCNSTGFCLIDNSTSSSLNSHDDEVVPSTEPKFVLVRKMEQRLPMEILPPSKIKIPPFKVRERKSCDTCRMATDRVRKGLEDNAQQIRIIKSLLDACESVQNYVNQCKRLVFQYGPLVMANLRKLLSSNDLCYLTHMCEVPVPPKGKTNHLSTEQMLQQLRSEVAKMLVL